MGLFSSPRHLHVFYFDVLILAAYGILLVCAIDFCCQDEASPWKMMAKRCPVHPRSFHVRARDCGAAEFTRSLCMSFTLSLIGLVCLCDTHFLCLKIDESGRFARALCSCTRARAALSHAPRIKTGSALT